MPRADFQVHLTRSPAVAVAVFPSNSAF